MGAKGCKIPRRWHEKFGGLEDQDVSEAFKHNYKEMRWEMSRILEDQERPETPKPCYEDKQRPPSHGPRTTGRVTLSQKVFVPIKHRPNFNFVGHILGPKGSKIKQLEQKIGWRIGLWGMGSQRNRNKGDRGYGEHIQEHLNDKLHMLIAVRDQQPHVEERLRQAVEEAQKMLQLLPE